MARTAIPFLVLVYALAGCMKVNDAADLNDADVARARMDQDDVLRRDPQSAQTFYANRLKSSPKDALYAYLHARISQDPTVRAEIAERLAREAPSAHWAVSLRDRVALEDRCSKQDADACLGLVKALTDIPKVFDDTVADLYKKACALGRADACRDGRILLELRAVKSGSSSDREKAEKEYQAGCELNRDEACFKLGLLLEDASSERGWEASQAFVKACKLGFPNNDACVKGGVRREQVAQPGGSAETAVRREGARERPGAGTASLEQVQASVRDRWCGELIRSGDGYEAIVGVACSQCFDTYWPALVSDRERCKAAPDREQCFESAVERHKSKIARCVDSTFKILKGAK